MRLLRLLLVLVFLAGFTGLVSAQTASTSLRGIVSDPSGASIPGATVNLKNEQVGTLTSTQTNDHGEYSFQQLTPGRYSITVNSTGFAQRTLTANLLVAQPATVDVKLSLTADTVTVDVSGATEAINTTDATIGNAINNETIMQLPSDARNPQTLLALQPGVLYLGSNSNVNTATNSADSRNGAVSGARPDQTNITLDGLDNNNQIAPAAFTGVLRTTLDATEEFRVTTSSANADTGRSSGGQINLVTRSGTNTVHGALYEYNRSNIFEANDWFVKSGQISSGLPNTPPKLIRNTYGARLGGPIRHDRIFLFGNYEGSRINEGQNVTQTVPTDSLRAGNLAYTAADGSTATLTPAQVASMDPNCTSNGTCPLGPGVDPASVALFQTYPHANGFNTGDGLNTASYTFSSPTPTILNVYIARMDFNPSDKHRFYVRGSFQNDTQSDTAYFPGQPPRNTFTDDSRGISGNYTWTATANLVNNLRYGYTHQSFGTTGIGQGNYVTFRSLATPQATTRSSFTSVPLQNLVDDLTWTKGKHTLQFGANYRRFTYNNSTNANSFNTAIANAYWMYNAGFANQGGSFDPAAFGLPTVDPGFASNYDFAVSMLAGLTNEETDRQNYHLSADGKTGSLLALGAPVVRSFRANEFEYYVEDSFKPTPNLTLTAGLRHTILQTPWETNGQQVQPTINMHQWFLNRGQQAALGKSVQPVISFGASGKAHNAKPFYPMNWGNIAPRFAIAWSPTADPGTWMNKLLGGAGKSSIRAGFGVYYDHYGEGLVTNYSRSGSFGLSSSLTNPSSVLTADTTPRFSGLHNLPGLIPAAASTVSYPQTPSTDPNGTGFAITTGLDDHLQTPYSEVFNLSFQRELKGGFTIEADYIGRLGRHLLQQIDLAQPLDLVDPGSGMDYYKAATMLAQYADQQRITVPTIAYWENLFPDAKGTANGNGVAGNSATQNIYSDLMFHLNSKGKPANISRGNETNILYNMDIYCYPGCGGQVGRYWPLQYSSLYVTSSLGSSSYNAGQITVRHAMRHDFQFDLSYTLSNSMDMGSDTESNPTNTSNSYGFILDAFNPYKNYARSDFNTTHLFTGDWILQLPLGHGQPFAGNAGHLVNSVIGGWSTSGIIRRSSGLPFSVYGNGWATNWEYESAIVTTAQIKMNKHLDANGSPQAFGTPLVNNVNFRLPYPGEAGQRNNFIGDGYFDVDAGLHKTFNIAERYHFELAAELFNVTNSVRFDVHQLDTGSADGAQLGVYSGALTTPRHAQLSGRFEF